MALYNKMRPKTLSEVMGQEKIVKVLKDNLLNDHLPNAMLFVGTRGTGKTSVARIISKIVNCMDSDKLSCCDNCPSCIAVNQGSSLDVIELDAASNNGVDDIRGIIEKAYYKPVAVKKVIILDEVHMLSNGAFNALLKILEEPPAGCLFILCTTEYHKIPATIVSRCRKYCFEAISEETIKDKLLAISKKIGVNAEDEALALIAKAAKGSMRDAESIFETFIDSDTVTALNVREMLGYSNEEHIFKLLKAIKDEEVSTCFSIIKELQNMGISLINFCEQVFQVLFDILEVQLSGDISSFNKRGNYCDEILILVDSFSKEQVFKIIKTFEEIYAKRNEDLSLLIPVSIVGLCGVEDSLKELKKRISVLEGLITSCNEPKETVVREETHDKSVIEVPTEFEPVLEEKESDPTSTKEITNETKVSDLTDADFEELRELGFVVEDSTGVTEESKEDAKEKPVIKKKSGMDFFEDFARQFA
ncbi:MAG: DNA polymerase III subunit gamma/tau [Lachnospiraceae bacterium]|nr:DNA polymerase III subunit gamma/tau [Lachnospiraceae bacterium]